MIRVVHTGSFNVYNSRNRTISCLQWMTRDEATQQLAKTRAKYPPGSPYPNGKGFYPDFGFRLVERVGREIYFAD